MSAFNFIEIFGNAFGVGLLIWISALGFHLVFQWLKSVIWA